MIAREGANVVTAVFFLTVLLVWGGLWAGGWLGYLLITVGLLFMLFTLYFFRNPKRIPPAGDDLLLAPADGKVIAISRVTENTYIKGEATQISIFLSPLDVHVNWVPAAGKIEYLKYHPGLYLVAWHEKSSTLNERSEFGLLHPSGTRIFFRQITGFIARRIVYDLNEGDKTTAGQRFGMMKFGSRMDIIVPDNVELTVKKDDHTIGAVTVMGRFPRQ
ncbi:MAG: phosphatidylserine decarboxylase family protein [Rhodothermaceae bacterium]|nr:phosphatidylserine decarboxylase family protein [Rhodothermaceae bacterium]